MQLMISGDECDSPSSISSPMQPPEALLFAGSYVDLSEAERALLPFLAWAYPLIEQDQNRVIACLHALQLRLPACLDAANLVPSVNTAFARPLLALCSCTLILTLGIARYQQRLMGDTPEARLDDFIAQLTSSAGRDQLERDYPLLRADVEQRSAQTADFLVCLLERIAADYVALGALMSGQGDPGLLLHFSTEAGDRHINGFSVARLRFENGEVYFKPRSMALDIEYSRFLGVLRQNGVTPDQQAPATLDFGDYGYAAAVAYREADSEETLHAYYRRFGGLAAIAHMLGTTDLHHENLIAAGAYPIIIDVETLFQPNHAASRVVQAQHNAFVDTILCSGLLPCGDKAQSQVDFSALFMPRDSLFRRQPIGAGTDQLHLSIQKVETPFAANMARLDGKMAQPHQYADDMTAGFEETYRALYAIKNKLLGDAGFLARFKPLSVRVLVRSTQVYSYLQKALAHPDFLAQSKKREDLIARIRPQKAGWTIYRRCWPSERQALLRGDVPYFTAEVCGTDLRDDNGQLLGGAYRRSGWDESQKRIRAMSQRDLARQSRLLQQSVFCTTPAGSAMTWWTLYPPSPLGQASADIFRDANFVSEAEHIGDHIIAAGFASGGHVTHYQLETGGHDALRPFAVGPELYDGLAGIAVFFGELWQRTGAERFRKQAKLSLASARREYENPHTPPDSVGGFSGVAGWIYALVRLGIQLERRDWIDEAFGWLPWIAGRADTDAHFDVIGGVAGALLVLVELDRIAPERGALVVARACAQRLVSTATHDSAGAHWIGAANPEHALTGFSHGAAGIGAALARFAAYSGDDTCMTLASEAFRFERANRSNGGWSDLREKRCSEHSADGHLYAWCHGAPGIGLARMAFPGALCDPQWRRDVEECVALSCEHAFGGSHCLCHGQLGNLELLMKFQDTFPAAAQVGQWHNAAERLLAEGRAEWRGGSVSGLDLLGLMTGLAGIGYALLRIAAPQDVPSVLLLELPGKNDKQP
jgi:type 2 lantibiotic biosynthesis protein LanM